MKKSFIKKTAAALLAVIMLFAAVPMSAGASAMKPTSMLVLGDSIATGYGLTDTTKRFADLVAKRYGIESTAYSNKAIDGLVSTNLVCNDADARAAELITISIGGNDLIAAMVSAANSQSSTVTDINGALAWYMANNSAVPALFAEGAAGDSYVNDAVSVFSANLNSTLGTIRTANPSARIVLLSLYNPLKGYTMLSALDAAFETAVIKLNDAMAAAATTHEAEIADVYTAFATDTATYVRQSQMDVHPTEAGHAVIAELIAGVLANYSESAAVKASYVAATPPSVIYSVDIAWGSLEFTYTQPSQGEWNPETHKYDNAVVGGWSWDEGANVVTVSNHSNAGITVGCDYQNLAGRSYTMNIAASATTLPAPDVSTGPSNPTVAPTMNFTVESITGELPQGAQNMQLGVITVYVSSLTL